jgi:uncharacterized RDD family membrane protein YckC
VNQTLNDSGTPSYTLFSPEGVQLEIPIAGPGSRILAYVIDAVALWTVLALLFFVLIASFPIGARIDHFFGHIFREAARHAQNNPSDPNAVGAVSGIVFAIFLLTTCVVETGYFTFWEMVTNGQSMGKAISGLRVVRINGLPVDLRTSLTRNLMRAVDILPSSYVVGFASMLISPNGQRLGDHAAGTIVIRLDRPEAAREIVAPAAEPILALTRAQIAQLGPREIDLIWGTLRRVSSLPGEAGAKLLREVAEALKLRLALSAPLGIDDQTFLREILRAAERYSHVEAR